jgi:hypothetical protein
VKLQPECVKELLNAQSEAASFAAMVVYQVRPEKVERAAMRDGIPVHLVQIIKNAGVMPSSQACYEI